MIIVLMGVSGSGKSTIGRRLSERSGAVFADADDFHPAANKAKMAAGHPLNDDDRQPWLETLNGVLRGWFADGRSGILACSALKARYRETLGAGLPEGTAHFVLLDGSPELLAQRLAARKHEFMNAALLASQLKTLEPPAENEAYRVGIDQSPEAIVDQILAQVAVSRT